MNKTKWVSNEQKAKVHRIEELTKEGFNTPRFFYLPSNPNDSEFVEFEKWANKVHKENPDQIYNIRSYKRNAQTETVHSPHITDISFKELINQVLIMTMKNDFFCMIDAETPDNGRLAGNVTIIQKESEVECILEYCDKSTRAMVRDADISIKGKFSNLLTMDLNANNNKSIQLKSLINRAYHFSKKNVTLEWCWMSEPAGILQQELIFWEYRKFKEI